jgi:SAM-dependent methyltransferase
MTNERASADGFEAWNDFWRMWDACRESADEAFYAEAVGSAGRPSVDLGLGYGRLARILRPDIAIDASPGTIRAVETELARLGTRVLEGNIEDYDLPRKAKVSYCARNTLNYIVGSRERVAALANIRRNTKRGGLLIFDVLRTDLETRRAYDGLVGQVATCPEYALYLVETIVGEDPLRFKQQGIIEWVDGRTPSRIHLPPIPSEYVEPHEVAMELSWAGWSLVSCAGDYRGSSLRNASQKQIWVARNGEEAEGVLS